MKNAIAHAHFLFELSGHQSHKITPIPKKGDLLEIINYRPISLLCILSKVLESIIYHKIIDFIRPKLSRHQFGFMKNKSCLTQLLLAFSTINHAVDNKEQVDMVYLDFKKAFDSVPHSELLYKLWRLGITGNLWCWFQSYLNGRSHYVTFDNAMSDILPVLSGVPKVASWVHFYSQYMSMISQRLYTTHTAISLLMMQNC